MAFESEKALFMRKGHNVITFLEQNSRIDGMNPISAAAATIWSRQTYCKLSRLLRATRPHLAHFHNTFLLISPAAYYACREFGVPVVQTLHNFRLICPGALLMRNGRVCEDCVGRPLPWPGVLHGCWRGSRLQTSVVAFMLAAHRLSRTWTDKVDLYIALTQFARQKLIQGGLPADKIVVKPNFVAPDPGMGDHDASYALFVGRLSKEKGVLTLLQAWCLVDDIPLKLLGDGPLRNEAHALVGHRKLEDVEILGPCSRQEVLFHMKRARFLVFPSSAYEGFPLTMAEAFACGLPVIASRLGAMAELVEDGRTGLHFTPGDPEDLAAKVAWAWSHPNEMKEMSREARQEYELKYTAERNYEMLLDIYQRVLPSK